jgi:phage-related minor tail protein
MAISAEFTADFSQYTAAAGEAETALDGVTESAAALGADVALTANLAGEALRDFGGQVVDLASEYLTAFAEEEAATKRLEVALRNAGVASTDVVTAYGEMASQFQTTTRYADDAITAAQTAFTQIGQVGPEQMQPAIQAAADLAEGLGIGIEDAALLMSRALGSGGESLGRLKQILGDNIETGAGFEEIMGAINAQFGGQAVAAMDTTEGKLAALGNQWDDLKGKMGEVIASALTPLLELFSSLSPELQTIIVAAVGLTAALTPIAIAFGALVSAVAPLITLIAGAGGLSAAFAALLPFLGPAGLIVAGIAAVYLAFKYWDDIVAIARAVYEGIKRWLVDGFQALLAPITATIEAVSKGFKWLYDKVVGGSYVPDLVNGIGAEFGRLNEVMVQPAQQATGEVISAFNRMAHNIMLIETDAGGVARDAFGRPVVPGGAISALPASLGQQNISVVVNGSVLSTEEQLAAVMENALMGAYRRGGQRLPV